MYISKAVRACFWCRKQQLQGCPTSKRPSFGRTTRRASFCVCFLSGPLLAEDAGSFVPSALNDETPQTLLARVSGTFVRAALPPECCSWPPAPNGPSSKVESRLPTPELPSG